MTASTRWSYQLTKGQTSLLKQILSNYLEAAVETFVCLMLDQLPLLLENKDPGQLSFVNLVDLVNAGFRKGE